MKIFKNLVLIFILTLGVVLGVDHARSSDDYIVALEFKQTKNLMKMSDTLFSTYGDCVDSEEYKFFQVVGNQSGSKYICTNKKSKY
jgi:hypothetical protein